MEEQTRLGSAISLPHAGDPWNVQQQNRAANWMYSTMMGLSGEWRDHCFRESPGSVF
jgi:hypothetical protein